MFELLKTDLNSNARLGRLTTTHGVIDTPVFMPVGTQGSVKALDPRELREMGTEILLGNTYHLSLRPGMDIVRAAGGLHQFINWPHPILTDSGGFQVFSLARIRKIKAHGVEFRSHLDGSLLFLGPKEKQRTIEMRTKLDAVRLDLSYSRQAENLKAAAVGQNRMWPIDELMQAAGGANDVHAGAKGEMVGIAEENFRPHLPQFAGVKRLNAPLCSHRHKDGSVNDTVCCG